MYLLDTGVVWALRGRDSERRDEALLEWIAGQMLGTLFVSAITMMEFESGARALERKDKVAALGIRGWIETRLRPAFQGRVIAVDDAVVRRWAQLGYSEVRDGMLAATALENGLAIATGDVTSFKIGKVKTFNPWTYAGDAEELDWRRASQSAPIWLKNLFVRA